ncbi:topoisomerase DNA-binding C4 zinc finger domain-containing protein [Alkalihalobacillus sp. NPDC078783]
MAHFFEFDRQIHSPYLCKRCGAPLIKRTGKRGPFYGCTTFPACKHTEALPS